MTVPTRRSASLGLALCLAGLSVACGLPSGGEQGSVGLAIESAAQGLELSDAGFLSRMADAPWKVAYQGIRRVTMQQTVRGETRSLTYREDVACDGAGNFDIRCLEVVGGGLADEERELFMLLQDTREGLLQRYRDFRIRDLERCLESHRLTIEQPGPGIAGQACETIRVQRLESPTSFYRAWVEPQSALVMRWEQRQLDGLLLAEVEFESIDFDPVLTGRELRGDLFQTERLDTGRSLAPQVGFDLLEPQSLPAGYRLDSADLLTDAFSRKHLVRVYGDGCDSLVFLQTAPEEPPQVSGQAYVDVLETGALVMMAGRVEGSQVALMGRVTFAELRRFLQSSRKVH